jgi:hypothetical protein
VVSTELVVEAEFDTEEVVVVTASEVVGEWVTLEEE